MPEAERMAEPLLEMMMACRLLGVGLTPAMERKEGPPASKSRSPDIADGSLQGRRNFRGTPFQALATCPGRPMGRNPIAEVKRDPVDPIGLLL
jgi:hypothetical protein